MTPVRTEDPAGLGRGTLTRWMPVLLQAPHDVPSVQPFPVADRSTPRRFVLAVILSAWRLSLPAAALAVIWQVSESFVPIIMGAAIDRALEPGDAGQLALWLAVLAMNFAILSLAYRFSSQLTAFATEHVEHRLRVTLSRAVLHPPTGSSRRPDGSVVSTITNDVGRLAAVGLTVYPVAELAGIVFIGASLVFIHWQLGIIVLIGAPITVGVMLLLSARLAHDTGVYQGLLAETVGQATDLVTGYRVIKGLRAETEATRRYREASRKTLFAAHRNVRLLGRFLLGSEAVGGLFAAGVAVLAGWFALTGQLSVGGLIAAVGLAQALLSPMQMLAQNAVPTWAAALASGTRILGLLKGSTVSPSQTAQEDHTVSPVPAVSISTVTTPPLRVAPGELVGVRADDVTAGVIAAALLNPRASSRAEVRLDQYAASQLHPDTYRSRVIALPHHAALFSGSVAENVGADNAPPETIDRALRAAGCDGFVGEAGGLQTPVGEMGNRFSGGQRQRLALARAFATDPPVLVLHDPTTAVDSVTEAAIASQLPLIRTGRTTIVIASSPALLGACDRVVDLRPAAQESNG